MTAGAQFVAGIFGTLMLGVPVPAPEKISPTEQIDGLIPLYASKIAIIERRDNVGKPDEITGLQEVYQYLTGLVQRLEQDPEQKEVVKKYMDTIGKLENQVKGLAQRGQQAAKKAMQGNGEGQPDPKAMVQAQHAERMAAIKEHATSKKAAQAEHQKGQKFIRDQRRADAGAFAEIERTNEKAKAQNRMASLGEKKKGNGE